MNLVSLLLLGLATFAFGQEATEIPTLGGGLTDAEVTDENTQVLASALSTGNYSDAVGDKRVCYSAVNSLQTQVVAGENYYFYITGCDVTGSDSEGVCSSDTLSSCSPMQYEVVVFEQIWTNTLEVSSITAIADETSSPTNVPGGWSKVDATDENTQLLAHALSDGNYSAAVSETRVCYAAVWQVESQVVAGVNYRFHIQGCNVTGSASEGACSTGTLKTCVLAEYIVQVFYQSWTSTLEVTSISLAKGNSSEPNSTTPSPETESPAPTRSPATNVPKTSEPAGSNGNDREQNEHLVC